MSDVCEYCQSGSFQSIGIHLPSDFDDREPSRDGKVFVAKCDACGLFNCDVAAAAHVEHLMGWTWHKSYDKEDDLDPAERAAKANTDFYRPYFKITLKEAEEFSK